MADHPFINLMVFLLADAGDGYGRLDGHGQQKVMGTAEFKNIILPVIILPNQER
jgi:hypothetical protein